jgi:hydroxyacylglutathione hydrolase
MPVTWIPGRGFLANSYLVSTILIDAGVLPSGIEPYRGAIDTIVLTHCHYDHTAYLREIAHICHAGVAIHHLDAPGLFEDHLSLALHFGARSPGIAAQRILSEGDRIGPLEVLHTPGHTPGSICLYLEEENLLISGDTVFTDEVSDGSISREGIAWHSLSRYTVLTHWELRDFTRDTGLLCTGMEEFM